MKGVIVAVLISMFVVLSLSPAMAFTDPEFTSTGEQGGIIGSIWDYYHGCAGAR